MKIYTNMNFKNLLVVIISFVIGLNTALAEEPTIMPYPIPSIPSVSNITEVKNINPVMNSVLTPQQRTEEIQKKQDSIKTKVEEKRVLVEKEIDQKRISKIMTHSNQTLGKFGSMLDRINILRKKTEERILKIEKTKNVDMSATKGLLKETEIKIIKTREDIVKARQDIEEILKSGNAKESLVKVKDIIRTVNKSVIDAHQSLSQVIKTIKVSSSPKTVTKERSIDDSTIITIPTSN